MRNVCLQYFVGEEAQASALGRMLNLTPECVATHGFPDGEIIPRVPDVARTVIAYRSLDRPDEKIVELLLACDAWRRAGAARLVLVAPYLCYMRQDAVFAPGEPVSQRVIGRVLGSAFDRIVTVDAHLHRTTRLDDLWPAARWTDLHATAPIAAYLGAAPPPPDLLIVGPDVESAPWVAALAAAIAREATTFRKHRQSDAAVSLDLAFSGALRGRPVLLLDDICSSGGTLEAATSILARRGANPIDIVVTHALFAEAVRLRLIKAGARRIVSCDGCTHPTNAIGLAPVLAGALQEEGEA